MNLARQLGAAMVTLPSDNVPLAVIRYARGERDHGDRRGQVGDHRAGAVPAPPDHRRADHEDERRHRRRRRAGEGHRRSPVPACASAPTCGPERASIAKMVLVIAAVTGINLLALPVIGYRSASILYLMTVIALAFFTDRVAVLIAAGLSAMLWNYFFLPPRFTFLITKLEDVLMFFLYFLTAAALAFLMSRLRMNQRMLAVRARRMGLLLDLSQSLSRQTIAGRDRLRRAWSTCRATSRSRWSLSSRRWAAGLQTVPQSLSGIEVDEKEYGRGALVLRQPHPLREVHGHAAHGPLPLRPSPHRHGCGRRPGRPAAEGRRLASRPGGFPPDARPHAFPFHRAGAAGRGKPQEPDGTGIGAAGPGPPEHGVPRAAHAADHDQGLDHGAHGPGHGQRRRRRARRCSGGNTDRGRPAERHRGKPAQHEQAGVGNAAAEAFPGGRDGSRLRGRRFRAAGSPRDHPLTISIDEDVPPVSLDFILMVQVLANLLGNVAAHTPAGTPVQLGVEKDGGRRQDHRCRQRPRGGSRPSCRTCSRRSSAARRRQREAWAWAFPSARASWRRTAGRSRHSSTARAGSR